MKKRLLIISIIVVVVAVFAGGTYAWFNANDSITNTFNVGGVTVEQIEQQRNPDTGELEDFENGKIFAVCPGLIFFCRIWKTGGMTLEIFRRK